MMMLHAGRVRPRLLVAFVLLGVAAVACDQYFGEDPTGLVRDARLVGLELDPDSVNITDAARTAAVRVTVDAPDGVDSARVTLVAPGGDEARSCATATVADQGGDLVEMECTVTLAPTDTAGSWTVDGVVIHAVMADPLTLTTADLDEAGYPNTLRVARDRTELRALDLEPDTVDVSTAPATVQASVELVHVGPGIDSVRVALQDDGAGAPACLTTAPTGGDRFDGLWSCDLEIPETATSGPWRIGAVTSWAGPGQPGTFDADSVLSLGQEDRIQVTDGQQPNEPPTATITAPADGNSFIVGDAVTFEGSATDAEDGTLTGAALSWSSDLDGALGAGATLTTSALSVGAHTITLTATDGGGASDAAQVGIRVTPAPTGFLVFTSERTGTREFFQVGADGSGLSQLTVAEDNSNGAWSPAGSRIAYGDGSTRGIHVMNSDGSAIQRLTDYSSGSPSWSPDGSELAIQATDGNDWEVFVIDPATGDTLRVLTDNTEPDQYPDWSPDGTEIVVRGGSGLKRISATDGALIEQYSVDGRHPTWSPDGSEIAFDQPVVGGYRIAVLDVATGTTRQLTEDSTAHVHPTWSPDGTYIAYAQAPTFSGEFDLYITHADGTGPSPRQLTTDPATDFYPDWTATVTEPGNQPPVPEISTPSPDQAFTTADTITFQGGATDPEDGSLSGGSLVWTSDVDGALGTGNQFSRGDLSVGTHVITLTATDSEGASASTSVTITVEGAADLGVAMTVSPDPVTVDSTLSHAITVGNQGPDPVTDVRWTLLVEGDVLISSPNQEGCSDFTSTDPPSKLFDCSIDSLAVDDVLNFQLDVVPQQAGQTLTSTATIESWTGAVDPSPASNTVSETTSVASPPGAPSVSIDAPTDNSLVQLGDTVVFQGTATDPEDGDLSASIAWSSSQDGAIGTGATLATDQLASGVHTITASVTDSDGATATASIEITVGILSTPDSLNVTFGGTASLPVSLGEPAPAGGLVVDFSSSDPSAVGIGTPSITIPAGATTGNGTVSGVAPGEAVVTASTGSYGSARTVVATTASLNILESSVEFPESFDGEEIRIRFESGGSAAAAPAGGTDVALSSSDSECVSVPSSVTIPGGQVDTTALVTYAGLASAPCSATVTATATDIDPDSVPVQISSTPNINLNNVGSVGAGLMDTESGFLGANDHGGVTVTLTSSDPSVLLVSPNDGSAGTASTTVDLSDGSSGFSYRVHGVEGTTGTATITASAPNFADDSVTATVVQPGVALLGVDGTQETLDGDDPFLVRVGIPTSTSVSAQRVRSGASAITATVSNSDAAVGQVLTSTDTAQTVTVQIQPGQYQSPNGVTNGGVAFLPSAGGTTSVSVGITGYLATDAAVRSITVSTPNVNLNNVGSVGAGLMDTESGFLGASEHGGVTVTLTSSDPSILLLSPNDGSAGTASTTVDVPNGSTGFSYRVHGVEGTTGTATITASAPGFADDSVTATVVQPGVALLGVDGTQETLDGDDPFLVRVGIPTSTSVSAQRVRSGASALTATVSNSDAAVGQVLTSTDTAQTVTVQIQPGQYQSPNGVTNGGVAFLPSAGGTTSVSVGIAGYLATDAAVRSITVSTPNVNLNNVGSVGAGLMDTESGFLGASEHGGVTVTLTSSDPSILLLSPNDGSAGTASTTVDVPNGSTGFSYRVHGVEGTTGTATITASAPGFADDSVTATVVQPGVALLGVDGTQTTLDPNDPFLVRVGIPTSTSVSAQRVRSGASALTATVSNSSATVGQLLVTDSTGQSVSVEIQPGQYQSPNGVTNGGVAFDPIGDGTTTVSAAIAGYLATDAAARSITVTAPGITLNNVGSVGAGLMDTESGFLGASEHGGVTVTLTSSDPSILLLSPNDGSAGTASTTVDVSNGSTGFSYRVHGVEGTTGTATVTASAPGFTDATVTVTVVQPGVALVGVDLSQTAGDSDDPFLVRVGVPTSTSVSAQRVRSGASALTATVSNSDATVGQVLTSTDTAQTVTVQIQPGQYQSPNGVTSGGVAFDPLAAGTSTVSTAITGFLATDAAGQTITVQ